MSESDLLPSQPITHRTELLPGLLSKADRQATIPEGFRRSFRETDGLLHLIVSVIEAERRCCRFLRFCFTLEPDGGASLVGSDGA